MEKLLGFRPTFQQIEKKNQKMALSP